MWERRGEVRRGGYDFPFQVGVPQNVKLRFVFSPVTLIPTSNFSSTNLMISSYQHLFIIFIIFHLIIPFNDKGSVWWRAFGSNFWPKDIFLDLK